jgi:diguanylate cyclase (GGDEF)-like protein
LREPDAPWLALLDWQMPGMDGIQVCREVRKEADQPYTYLVLVTGHGGREQMLDGLEAGADDFLAKPVDASELKARLVAGRRIVALQEKLRELATRDALTGLWNRAAILDLLKRELDRSRREDAPLSVVLADLDHFKHVNDALGHLVGDQVLRQAAQRMQAALRPYDTVGRYGGEEFLVVLPGCGAGNATSLAERLRQSVAAEPMNLENGEVAVTLSLGIAVFEAEGEAVQAADLLRTADQALYRAKAAGRNCALLGRGANDSLPGTNKSPKPAFSN